MFLTDPNAEIKVPKFPGVNESVWSWIRLGVYAPYYLVQIKVTEGSGDDAMSMGEHFLLSEVSQLQDLVRQQDSHHKIISVSMLIPHYMLNSTDDHFSFGQISEIWGCKETGAKHYVLANGEQLDFSLNDEKPDFKLLFKMIPEE